MGTEAVRTGHTILSEFKMAVRNIVAPEGHSQYTGHEPD